MDARLIDGDYEEIDLEDIPKYQEFNAAAHCMFYAENRCPVLKIYNPRATVHMQLRFDGHLGFPGGCVDKCLHETPVEAVNREITEENGLEPGNVTVNENDLCCVHRNMNNKLLLYFFVKKITLEKMKEIEKKAVIWGDFGNEVFGIIRVPLYIMNDGFGGFPAFLKSPFIGNAKQQLIKALIKEKLMTEKEIDEVLKAKPSTT